MWKDSLAFEGPCPADGEQRAGDIETQREVGVEFPDTAEGPEVKRDDGHQSPNSGAFNLFQYLGLDARIGAPASLDLHENLYLVLANPGQDL